MINMTVLVNQLIELFIIICVGYLVYKVGILNENVNKHINSLILNVTMPCLIISSVLSIDNKPDSSTLTALFIVSMGFFIIMPMIAFVIVKLLLKTIHIAPNRQGAYMFMMIFSNVGFMGIPILQAACGKDAPTAVFYAAVLNIFFNIAAFTYGVIMISYGDTVKTAFKIKDLVSPGILCSIIGLVIYGFNIHFPSTVENVFASIGDLTPALAMILVGSTLATTRLLEVFNQWKIYVFALIKQVILPIAMYPVFRFLISDDLLFNVMFIEFLMPIANLALMLATQHELDYKFVSKTIFISTIMSLASIPLVMHICNLIY